MPQVLQVRTAAVPPGLWEERERLGRRMGRIFIEHIGGTRLFSCASCDTGLTWQLFSTVLW